MFSPRLIDSGMKNIVKSSMKWSSSKICGRHANFTLSLANTIRFKYDAQYDTAFVLTALLSSVLCSTILTSKMAETETEPDRISDNASRKVYRRTEVAQHVSPESGGVWVTYGSGVYDVTDFVANHPGGAERLLLAAGQDLSCLWTQLDFQFHMRSPLALELLEDMRIGDLHVDDIVRLDDQTLEEAPLVYPTNKIYDCIVIGSGVSGLQCASSLVREHAVSPQSVLVLEAQDYVGGRVRQVHDFVLGVPIDVGAEFLHGANTLLTKFAKENDIPLKEMYCWAHGDGGPLEEPVPSNGGYGLYWISDKTTGQKRLLRFDDKDADFVGMNEALWSLSAQDESMISDELSLYDFLAEKGFSEEMMDMAAGGYANTLCANIKELSLKQVVRWAKLWDAEGEEEGDFGFEPSYKCLIDHLKANLQIEIRSPVTHIQYPNNSEDPLLGLVKVTTERGQSYYAKSLVITSSPHVMKSGLMKFEPELSTEIREALDTTVMNNIVKVFLKFSEPVWPADLHGMVMTDEKFILPEIWFNIVADKVERGEEAKAYAIAFTTADFAKKLTHMPKDQVLKAAVAQMDEIFDQLEPRHMSGADDTNDFNVKAKNEHALKKLKKPSEAYLGGMFWDWNPQHHPYIGGGYSSPRAGTPTHLNQRLTLPYSAAGNMFFAGEGTNLPGATAHAAMESGVRAAAQVAAVLRK